MHQNNVINTTNLIHTLLSLSLSLSLLFRFKASTCFGHHLPILRRYYTNAVLVSVVCSCRCGLFSGGGETLLIPRTTHIYNPTTVQHTGHITTRYMI
jgi:hypothetical protein